jgi:hypothetical protein
MKKRKKDGILSRARKKSRAEQGPSPSSSSLQGEETESGAPRRVPLGEIPGKSWKIKQMPADLKAQLDALLSDGTFHSCRQLSKWLGDNGFVISHAAIHKYGQKFERRLDAIRMATEQARIVCEQFPDDDEQMQSALMRVVQTRLFEVLTAANEKAKNGENSGAAPTVAPVNITALARSVSGLARAETEHRKWVDRTRAGVAEVQQKVEEARAKGLSKDAAEQIRAVLMEI